MNGLAIETIKSLLPYSNISDLGDRVIFTLPSTDTEYNWERVDAIIEEIYYKGGLPYTGGIKSVMGATYAFVSAI